MSDRKSAKVRRRGVFGVASGGGAATLRLLFATSGALGLVVACSVVDKAEYEFDGTDDDDGDSGSTGTSGKGGSSGRGGSSGKGGTTGGGAGEGQGESGARNEGGMGAEGATGGTAGQGAEGGASEGGTSGSGTAATAGVGAEGGTGNVEGCGNGTTDPGEDCDDGNTDTETCTYGEQSCTVCASNCRSGPGSVRYCGDGRIDTDDGETCDDRNAVTEVCTYGLTSCTVCGSTCTADPGQTYYCGDGVVSRDFGEECDEGNANSNSAPNRCRANCQNPYCGDRVRDEGEQCDDGGAAGHRPGDGCTPDCHLEPRPSCRQFRAEGQTMDGNYPVDPDGPNGVTPPFPAYCDMTTDGGGWTLTYKVSNSIAGGAEYWWQRVMPGSGSVFPNQPTLISGDYEGPSMAVRAMLTTNSGAAEWRATHIDVYGRITDLKTWYQGDTGNGLRCFATGLGACQTTYQSCSTYMEGYILYNRRTDGVLPAGSSGYLCDVGWYTCQSCTDWSVVATIADAGTVSSQTGLQYVGDSDISAVGTTTLFWIR